LPVQSLAFQDIQAAVLMTVLLSVAPACACQAEACCQGAFLIPGKEKGGKMMLDHFRAIQALLQPSTAGLTQPSACFLLPNFPAQPYMPLLLNREVQCLSPAGFFFVQCKTA
jgi:hypothetical protein